jgi:hypothetical protein
VIEIGFALHGWPAVPRYLFAPAGTAAVLAGAGAGWLLAGGHWPGVARVLSSRWVGLAVVAAFAAVLLPTARSRVRLEHTDLIHERARTRQINRLDSLIASYGGASAVTRCGQPATWVEYQSIVAWDTRLNVGVVDNDPRRALAAGKPIVYFAPHRYGWHVEPIHTAPALVARCAALTARTAVR